jgi:23S rRNA (uracil1939-C5)-methyltransferase
MRQKEIVVTPEGWLSRGEASLRGDGRQLAIFGGIPGEPALVRLLKESDREVRARFVAPSRDKHRWRQIPPCERWASCGRCSIMHLVEEGQRAMRKSLWREAFAGIAEVSAEEGDPGSADSLHALTLLAGRSDEGRARLGMAGLLGGVLPVPACPVTTPELRMFMTAAAHHMLELDLRPYDRRGGTFRGIRVRESLTTGEAIAAMVFTRPLPFARAYAEALAQARPALVGVVAHWNDTPTLFDATLATTPSLGRPWYEEHAGELRFRLSALDPWYDTAAARDSDLAVAAWLDAQPGDAVVDVNCGAGLRTLTLAKTSGWAVGLDVRAGTLERARENASLNRAHAEFHVAEGLTEGLAQLGPRLEGRRPLAVVDTSTRGFERSMGEGLLALSPRKILLLGTNPRAMARDTRAFLSEGFRLAGVRSFHVDPHTPFSRGAVLLVSPDDTPPEVRAPRRKLVR